MGGSGETGRLQLFTHVAFGEDNSIPASDLIELSAELQRRFPDQLVESAGLDWLHQAVGEEVPLPPRETERWLDNLPISPQLPPPHEYIFLVLAWLGGAVSKQIAEQAIKAATDLVTQWMRQRRSKPDAVTQTAYILGPDGKVLKSVEVQPKRGDRRRSTPRRRRTS